MALIAAQIAAIIFLCFYLPSFLPLAAVIALVWLLSATSAAVLFSRKGAAEVKCAWFVVIAALPVAGALIYMLATVKKKPCGILKVNAVAESGLAGAAASACGTAAAGYDHAVYFKSGAEFLKRVLSEIEGAKDSVYIEFFIISRGHIFSALLSAVKRATANGARVKIIVDGLGSAFKIKKRDLKALRDAGAEVKVFRRITPLPLAKLNIRDHRKIVAVDGKVAFTGGVNLADEYANITSPYGHWKDNGVAVYGAAAKIFEGMFLSVWHGSHEMPAPDDGKYRCLPFYDSPPAKSFYEDACVYAINNASQRVHIFTPYFCVSGKICSALQTAARRGVDVKVILPHIPDKKFAFAIAKTYADELSPYGVQFYEYTPGFMHAKSLIADDKVFLGSYNFDYRSSHFNFECGVMLDGATVTEAEHDFEECLALSKPLEHKKNTLPRRLKRTLLTLVAPLI